MYHSSTTKRSFSGPACRNKNVAIVFVCLSISGYGAKPEQIPLQQNKVCQIIFPDKIAKIRGGFNPNYFALDKYDNILYIQCLTDFPNTNLSIITDDTSCYMLDLCYTEKEREECLHHRHCRQDLRQYSRTIRSRAEVVFPIAVKANAPGMDRGYSRAGCRGSSTGSKPVQELRRRT